MKPPFELGPRARKVLKYGGYVVLGLLSFVYALHLTFPYDRLKDKGVEALSSKYEVIVGGTERGWLPGDFALTDVQLRTRPSKPGDVPKVIFIKRLEIDVRVIASLLSFGAVVDIDASVGPGHITGTIELGGGRTKVAIDSRSLPLSEVPGLSSVVGLPMGGNGTVTARLDLPGGDWSKATARFRVDCPTCTIGGDGVKIKPRTMTNAKAAWVGDGIEVPRMFIDRLQAEFVISGGKFEMKQWSAQSPDGDLMVELSGTMAKSLGQSKVDAGCIKFRGTDELAKREAKFHGSLDLIGGVLMPDGLRHLKVSGTLGTMKYLPKACDGATPDGDGGQGGQGGVRTRPSLSNVPDAPSDGNGNAGANAGGVGPGADGPPPGGTINEVPPTGDGALTPKIDDVRPADHDAGPSNGADPGLGGAVPPSEGGEQKNGENGGGTGGGGEPEGTLAPSPGGADTAGPENGPPPVEGKEPSVENE